MTEEELHVYNKLIRERNDRVALVEKQTNTRSIYLIDDKIYAVYNNQLKSICTFLVKYMVDKNHWKTLNEDTNKVNNGSDT